MAIHVWVGSLFGSFFSSGALPTDACIGAYVHALAAGAPLHHWRARERLTPTVGYTSRTDPVKPARMRDTSASTACRVRRDAATCLPAWSVRHKLSLVSFRFVSFPVLSTQEQWKAPPSLMQWVSDAGRSPSPPAEKSLRGAMVYCVVFIPYHIMVLFTFWNFL
jgi:hypothetical protein